MKKLIIAHRGESFDAPENTLASINLAWERCADAVEIDVHLSKDRHVIVIHDANTKRITGINRKIKNSTLSELKSLDAGSWKDKKFAEEKIPTLDEVIITIPTNKKLLIEIKSDKIILPFIKTEIENFNLSSEQFEIISFDYNTVAEAKKIMPKHKSLLLADLDYTWYTNLISPSVENLIKKVKSANLDGLNLWAGKMLTKEFAQKVKKAGLLLYVWTVDDPIHAKKLFSWGIDGVTTNRANWLKNQLS